MKTNITVGRKGCLYTPYHFGSGRIFHPKNNENIGYFPLDNGAWFHMNTLSCIHRFFSRF